MGNRDIREFRLKQADEAAWRRARDLSRPASEDIAVRGIGLRRLQLIVCPSFEDGRAYEVREAQDTWHLFFSFLAEPWPALKLTGYEPLAVDPMTLASFFNRLAAVSIPLSPLLNACAGVDGTVFQLAIFGDLWSEWRFQWWSDPPPNWSPMVELFTEMLSAFDHAAVEYL